MLYNNLPIIYMDVEDMEDGVKIMSLVDAPAVGVNYLMYSEDDKMMARYSTMDEKHILNGVALIPDYPVLRKTPNGEAFYNVFTKEAIERVVERFFAERNNTSVNLNHAKNVEGCVIFESYIINREKGIAPAEFSDMPDGTWIISMKINDLSLWNDIKEGKYNGFSIEGIFTVSTTPKKEVISDLKQLFEWLKNN